MEKEFDFKNIGKQMPYRTPDGFFDRMQTQVSARIKVENRKKQPRMKLVIAATLAAAAMVLGIRKRDKYLPTLYLLRPILIAHIRMQWIILSPKCRMMSWRNGWNYQSMIYL